MSWTQNSLPHILSVSAFVTFPKWNPNKSPQHKGEDFAVIEIPGFVVSLISKLLQTITVEYNEHPHCLRLPDGTSSTGKHCVNISDSHSRLVGKHIWTWNIHSQRERLVFGCVRVIKKQRRSSLCLCVCERWRALGVIGTINMPPPPTKPSFVTTPSLDTTSNTPQPFPFCASVCGMRASAWAKAGVSFSLYYLWLFVEYLTDLNRSCVTQTSLECYLRIDYGWD